MMAVAHRPGTLVAAEANKTVISLAAQNSDLSLSLSLPFFVPALIARLWASRPWLLLINAMCQSLGESFAELTARTEPPQEGSAAQALHACRVVASSIHLSVRA